MFLKIGILKNFANFTKKKKTHLLGSLFNKIAGLFLKNTFCSYFCRALIETMIFYFLYFATVGSKRTCMYDFFVLRNHQRNLLDYYKVFVLAHLIFNMFLQISAF